MIRDVIEEAGALLAVGVFTATVLLWCGLLGGGM